MPLDPTAADILRPEGVEDDDANQEKLVDITHPKESDVICGRGGAALRHPGNQNYRRLIQLNKGLYITCLKAEKLKISKSIVAAVRVEKGRFLEKSKETGKWFDIGDKKAVEKTSQALREGQPKLKEKIRNMGGDPNAALQEVTAAEEEKKKTSTKTKKGKNNNKAKNAAAAEEEAEARQEAPPATAGVPASAPTSQPAQNKPKDAKPSGNDNDAMADLLEEEASAVQSHLDLMKKERLRQIYGGSHASSSSAQDDELAQNFASGLDLHGADNNGETKETSEWDEEDEDLMPPPPSPSVIWTPGGDIPPPPDTPGLSPMMTATPGSIGMGITPGSINMTTAFSTDASPMIPTPGSLMSVEEIGMEPHQQQHVVPSRFIRDRRKQYMHNRFSSSKRPPRTSPSMSTLGSKKSAMSPQILSRKSSGVSDDGMPDIHMVETSSYISGITENGREFGHFHEVTSDIVDSFRSNPTMGQITEADNRSIFSDLSRQIGTISTRSIDEISQMGFDLGDDDDDDDEEEDDDEVDGLAEFHGQVSQEEQKEILGILTEGA